MDCTSAINIDSELMLRIIQAAAVNRIPLTGSFEITHRCNFKCKHCYLGSQSEVHKHAIAHELDTNTILKIIDDFTQAGCLHLLLTGGDPLMRRDFPIIYKHAIKNGLIIRLFTNGTLLSAEVLEMLKTYPPREIEITLYGATENTYENVTGIKGSYKKCLFGIERLLSIHAPLKLKTMVLTLNRHEFFAMEQMAKNLGLQFRYDCFVQSQLNGDKTPLTFRIKPEEIVAIDFADKERRDGWAEQNKMYGGRSPSQDLYTCGAGLISFHIDSYGNLMPCISSVQYKYNLLQGNFHDGWYNFIPKMRAKKAPPEFICAKCDNRYLCRFCPAFFYLENNSEYKCSEYLCKVGHLRRKELEKVPIK